MIDPEHADSQSRTVPSESHAVPPASLRGLAARLSRILIAGIGGAVIGLLVGYVVGLGTPIKSSYTELQPSPHQIPKYPDGVSLRFAMVHDVLHERYPRHGKAYFEERNRQVRKALAGFPDLAKASEAQREKYFALVDDLGVGLDRVGEHDEGVRLLRNKLRRQESFGISGRDLYTTYANLGTVLIHGSFRKARDGDTKARATVREGLGYIHKSIEVNPQAHFGREIWQAVTVEYFLACMDNPKLLLRFDLIGNPLDKDIDPSQKRAHSKGPAKSSLQHRALITEVGAGEGWNDAVKTSHSRPVPFDEPVLGIIGLWRLGSGANPHFSLALAETMMRVGQRHIAWCAYERAARMAALYWPDAEIQGKMKEHCRKRQNVIEKQLPAAEVDKLRPRFEAELAHGERYQREYQEYEVQQIAAGASIDDPHFHDAFHKGRKPIASPVGDADQVLVEVKEPVDPPLLPFALLFAGLFAFVSALPQRRPVR